MNKKVSNPPPINGVRPAPSPTPPPSAPNNALKQLKSRVEQSLDESKRDRRLRSEWTEGYEVALIGVLKDIKEIENK